MGYPHHSKRLFIIDLPPEERTDKPIQKVSRVVTTAKTVVEYVLTSMADLSMIPADSIDLVFSGESIEHVSEDEAEQTMREAYRILKEGGYFCLDTPNARLTRLQSPGALIHAEHKKEYYFEEIKQKLTSAGFSIEETGGICPMRESIRSGVFNFDEMLENPVLDADPEVCYLLFFKCKKPLSNLAN